MRKLVKEKAVRFVLKLKCKCGREERYIIGYDYKTLKEAKKHIPSQGWNGWLLENETEICPICCGSRHHNF